MKIIENGLIPVYENENKEQLVNARELHEFLESRQDYSTWIKSRISKYDFIENQDYTTVPQKYGTANGGYATRTEYILTLDTAKEISMVENNSKGKEIRKYFIGLEKKLKQKQFESLEHFQKEQCQLGFIMDKLNLNEGSKIKLITGFNKAHNLSTEYLPSYTEEKITKSLSELLKQFNVNVSSVKFNKLLLEKGIIKELERPSSKGGFKKFKSIVNDYYGKNLISNRNQKETQPHYYEDKFQELINLVV
jgi:phage anti-repressor protein